MPFFEKLRENSFVGRLEIDWKESVIRIISSDSRLLMLRKTWAIFARTEGVGDRGA